MGTTARPVDVVLVDEQPIFREGVRGILETHSRCRVVAEAGDAERAVEVVAATAPDAVLIDIRACGPDALGTVRRIRAAVPGCRVIVLTADERSDLLGRLLELGVHGYLAKSVGWRELITAVHSVVCDPDRVVLSVSPASLAAGEADEILSKRQVEVLTLVSMAMSNGQIATRLSLTEPTVKRHLSNIFGRLGAVSRIDAVNKARELGLIGPVPPLMATGSTR